MRVVIHRDEEVFLLEDVDVIGPLTHAIKSHLELYIPIFIAVIVRHLCSNEVIIDQLFKTIRAKKITILCFFIKP